MRSVRLQAGSVLGALRSDNKRLGCKRSDLLLQADREVLPEGEEREVRSKMQGGLQAAVFDTGILHRFMFSIRIRRLGWPATAKLPHGPAVTNYLFKLI